MVKPTTSTVAVLAAAAVALLATSGLAIEIYDSKAADSEDGTTAVQFSGDRTARFGITDRTTTVTVIFNTTTFTSTVTPTCYTTNILVLGRVCQATKTILGRKKRGADLRLVEEGPIVGEQIPVVLIDGKEVDYQSLIKPQRVSRKLDDDESESEERSIGDDSDDYDGEEVDPDDALRLVNDDGTAETVRKREVEIRGLPEKCMLQSGRNSNPDAGRWLSGWLTFLSRITTTIQTTTVVFATHTVTASVTFKGCTPSDVTTIFPTSCP